MNMISTLNPEALAQGQGLRRRKSQTSLPAKTTDGRPRHPSNNSQHLSQQKHTDAGKQRDRPLKFTTMTSASAGKTSTITQNAVATATWFTVITTKSLPIHHANLLIRVDERLLYLFFFLCQFRVFRNRTLLPPLRSVPQATSRSAIVRGAAASSLLQRPT